MSVQSGVFVFSPEYPPFIVGGLGTHVGAITAALAAHVPVDVFVPARSGPRPADTPVRLHEVAVNVRPDSPAYWLCFGYAAAAAAVSEASRRNSPPAVIHCHDWMTIPAGIRVQNRLRRPLVVNVHLPQYEGFSRRMEDLGLTSGDLVLVNSDAVAREIGERGLLIRRLRVIPNGVDALTFSPAPEWPADAGYLLFVGRLVAQKGPDVLLQAFNALLHRFPESRLVVAGDGELEMYLLRLARRLGVSDRVEFVGWCTGPDLVRLYQRARAVVIPSRYEPFGIVALEAMACARPVVASAVGGLPEVMRHGVEGLLTRAGDHLDLARRIAALASDELKRTRMGDAGRQRALEFGWEEMARRTLAEYALLGHSSRIQRQNPAAAQET